MRKLTIIIIILISCIHCNQKENNETENVQELRNIYDSYLYNYGNEKEWQQNHQKLLAEYQNNPNPNYLWAINIAHEIYWPKDARIRLKALSDFKNAKEFSQYNAYNQFIIYFNAARLSGQIGETDSLISNSVKAEKVLGNNWELFALEKGKVRNLFFENLPDYSVIKEPDLETNIEYYEDLVASKKKVDIEVIRAAYAIAQNYYLLKEYQKSNQWLNKMLMLDYDFLEKEYYASIMDDKMENFAHLFIRDSINAINDKMYRQYITGKIPERTYKIFQSNKFGKEVDLQGADNALKISDSVLSYFNNGCEDKYLIINVLKNRSRIFEQLGRNEAKTAELLKAYHLLQSCPENMGLYLIDEEEILDQILVNHQYSKEPINFLELTRRKEYIDSLLTNSSEDYWKINSYFSNLETENIQLQGEYHRLSSQNSKIIFYVILSILVLLIFGIIYLSFMYKNNCQFKIVIEKKNEQLKDRKEQIQQKNKHLKKLKNLLEQRNQNLQNFAYKAAQDIQSPILAITENIEKIDKEYSPIFNLENREILDYLKNSTTDLSEMIETLLEYSFKEKNIERDVEVDTFKILKSVLGNLKHEIEKNQAIIKVPEYLPKVVGNHSLIEKLFQNLIANAIKFHRPNTPPVISISYKILPDHQVKYTITDNGIGIAKENQAAIFNIFQKLDNNNEFEGNGIGLFICKKIVTEFGGKIWLESIEGKGSKFHFTLRYTEGEPSLNWHIESMNLN